MGNDAGAPPLGEDVAEVEPLDVPAQPTFDKEAAGALIEIGVGLLNDCASAVVRAVAMKETDDKALAAEAAKAVVMSDKINKAVTMGAMQCAEKYAVRMEYAPETMLFGGLLIWGGQVMLSIRSLKATGAELRAERDRTAPRGATHSQPRPAPVNAPQTPRENDFHAADDLNQ